MKNTSCGQPWLATQPQSRGTWRQPLRVEGGGGGPLPYPIPALALGANRWGGLDPLPSQQVVACQQHLQHMLPKVVHPDPPSPEQKEGTGLLWGS